MLVSPPVWRSLFCTVPWHFRQYDEQLTDRYPEYAIIECVWFFLFEKIEQCSHTVCDDLQYMYVPVIAIEFAIFVDEEVENIFTFILTYQITQHVTKLYDIIRD
jgi:hypothetical protein